MKLTIEVTEIKGTCPVYKAGDKIVDNIYMHSPSSILPYYNALAKGVSPKEFSAWIPRNTRGAAP